MAGPGGGNSHQSVSRIERKDVGIQVSKAPKPKRWNSCMAYSLWTSAVIIAILASLPVWNTAMSFVEYLLFKSEFVVGPEMMEDLGMEGVMIFKQHDRDGDGVLSLEEFEPIAHRLLQMNDTSDYDLPIEEWDDVITIQSYFTPLEKESMSKSKDGTFSNTGLLDSLRGLKYWNTPEKEWKNFAAKHLEHFLPHDPHILESVGEVYHLIPPLYSSNEAAPLSSNRYLPTPLIREPDIMIHRLLSMFHPRPFVYSRFQPQGSVAVVRAINDKLVDISFRIHAEFQLNEPPFYPYWFTPAQFKGNIIISKDGTKVLHFHLYVPSDRKLNVDMEWLNGPKEQENMEVDIGFMERMELRSTHSSIHVLADGKNYTNTYIPSEEGHQQPIVWSKEISKAKAVRELEVKMFPFKKVDYYNFTDVYHIARLENKPVHSILLWGALDDQSC